VTDRRRRRPRPLTALGVLLLVGGVAVAGGVGWRTWVASPLAATEQERAAAAQAGSWSRAQTTPPATARPTEPVVRHEPRLAATVAVMVVPRFGRDWRRVVRQGVDEATILNSVDAGVGHYPGTAMPGGIGNFAIAAHDTGYGDAFRRVERLRVDDLIYLQTRDGWYTYRFRNFQWVQPTEVGVIGPVPETQGVAATARLITLTTCDPPYNAQEREIAYGTFVGFRPGPTPPTGAA
jgi:sortase A